ncbi:PIN domain-containing protein [Arcicella sp. DC2W]|uniref:PIN domain-containing protein n=1 Tax=Arcicella gelida TaxID=2984195 RepID=A0ABU5SA69_9BACT|nr:PIN domain-containing protein [Arcicella sp. DC2W]MEA5405382.1 PIN domain-containing protein [Arcicella sp. DC2W]
MNYSVLLDTSFFIRLLNDEDPLHINARGYFKYFLEQGVTLKVSTITIAEYCVKGSITDLPLNNIQILPFNLDHAKRTGEFARIVFNAQGKVKDNSISPRTIIPNDSKLFAQADVDKSIHYFVTSDARSFAIYNILRSEASPQFQIIDINTPFNEIFGKLDFGF